MPEIAKEIDGQYEAGKIYAYGSASHNEVIPAPGGSTRGFFLFLSARSAGIPEDTPGLYYDNGFSGFQSSYSETAGGKGWLISATSAHTEGGGMSNVSVRPSQVDYLVVRVAK